VSGVLVLWRDFLVGSYSFLNDHFSTNFLSVSGQTGIFGKMFEGRRGRENRSTSLLYNSHKTTNKVPGTNTPSS